ncbi:putative major facilitator superfamily, MFS transporter superfamily [Septoria linicola]|nr:putative major facilitator superfamily, MFS transporter superfamily [Septoria linicola]
MVSNQDILAPSRQPSLAEPMTIDEKKTTLASDLELVPSEKEGDVQVLSESEHTPAEYGKVLRKVDRFLLPLMWFCYGIQQTDKTSLGTQAIFGLRDDTNLVGQQYSWLTTIFYMTYMIGELPSNFLLQRWSLGRSLSLYMMCWGVCVTCIGAAQNWTHLMVLRGLQGFFECTISPGFVLVIGSWYTRDEHSSRSLFFQSANAGFGVIGNLSMYGIGSHAQKYGGLAPWRSISLFLGACTLVLSVICFFMLGSPKEVKWLSAEERTIAQARVVSNKAGRDVTGIKWSWPQVREAFRDPQLWFSMMNAFLSSVPNGGLTTFGGIVLNSFGFTELQVLLVEIPRSVLSVIIFVCVGFYTRKVPERRLYIMAAACIPAFVGLLTMSMLPNTKEHQWTKWGMYVATVPYVLALFLAWTLIPSNVAGRTKKTIISSATFVGYCVGNICGSQIFKSKDAPRYVPGTIGSCICLGMEFVLIVAWRLYYIWQNRRRDKAAAASGLSREDQERIGREMG